MSDLAVSLFSGGEGSLAATICYLDHNPGKKVLAVFNDTKSEHKDLYRFMYESLVFLKEKYGDRFEFKEVSDGRDIWHVQLDTKFLANNRVDRCSEYLKRKLSKRFIKDTPLDTDIIIGIDWTEIHRYEKARPNWEPRNLVAPLCDPINDKQKILQSFYKESRIKRSALYELGFPHNNCGGFCVKAGLAQFKMLWEKQPDTYRYHERKQEEAFKIVGRYPFLVKTVKGERFYVSLREYRWYLETGNMYCDGRLIYANPKRDSVEDLEDFGGCGCAI